MDGLTVTLVRPVTSPTPWLIVRLVAPVTKKLKVLLCASLMTEGLAVKLLMTGLSTTVTETVALVL